jgi:hypothetical protein
MPVLTDIRHNLLRYTTNAGIADDPVTIALVRKTKVAKPGGGHDKVPVTLTLQTFRLINQTTGNGIADSPSDGGRVRTDSYILIGSFDADIEPDDSWEETAPDGSLIQYLVDGLLPTSSYETRASVTAFAKEPQHG